MENYLPLLIHEAINTSFLYVVFPSGFLRLRNIFLFNMSLSIPNTLMNNNDIMDFFNNPNEFKVEDNDDSITIPEFFSTYQSDYINDSSNDSFSDNDYDTNYDINYINNLLNSFTTTHIVPTHLLFVRQQIRQKVISFNNLLKSNKIKICDKWDIYNTIIQFNNLIYEIDHIITLNYFK